VRCRVFQKSFRTASSMISRRVGQTSAQQTRRPKRTSGSRLCLDLSAALHYVSPRSGLILSSLRHPPRSTRKSGPLLSPKPVGPDSHQSVRLANYPSPWTRTHTIHSKSPTDYRFMENRSRPRRQPWYSYLGALIADASGDDDDIVELRRSRSSTHGMPCADWLRSVTNWLDPDLFAAWFSS
jgi:hypothetical protein